MHIFSGHFRLVYRCIVQELKTGTHCFCWTGFEALGKEGYSLVPRLWEISHGYETNPKSDQGYSLSYNSDNLGPKAAQNYACI